MAFLKVLNAPPQMFTTHSAPSSSLESWEMIDCQVSQFQRTSYSGGEKRHRQRPKQPGDFQIGMY